MSVNLKEDILKAAKLYSNETPTDLKFKHGDESLTTTMWAENANDSFRISLETYRKYQGQWCSTIYLSVNEAKALQKQLEIFIYDATKNVQTKVVDFGKPTQVAGIL